MVKGGTTTKLGTVEGALKVGRNAKITADSDRKVVVTGATYFKGPVTLDCDFECQSIRVEGRGFGPGGDVVVHGDLTVHGIADIDASVNVDGAISAESLDVGGHLESGTLTSNRVRVGGHMTTKGSLYAENIDVGGHMRVFDEVKLVNLRVGGHAEVGGGTISGKVKVRGHFMTTRKLTYGQLQVFGHLRLPGGSSGERLLAAGKVEFDGDTSCKVLEVNGAAKVQGNCSVDEARVNGKLVVSGDLFVSKKLEVLGTAEVSQELKSENLGVGGRLAAERISVISQADLAGEVETSRGLSAESIIVRKGSRIAGPLVGQEIDVGKDVDSGGGPWGNAWMKWYPIGRVTTVEDLYGKAVRIRTHSRALRVFGEVVEMEEGSMADEVVYTDKVELPKNYHLNKSPVKTTKLPGPPV